MSTCTPQLLLTSTMTTGALERPCVVTLCMKCLFFHRITLPNVSTTIFQWKLVKYNISLPTHNTMIGPFQGHRILPNRVDHQSWSLFQLIVDISKISLCQLVLPNCYLLPTWPLVLWSVRALSHCAWNVFFSIESHSQMFLQQYFNENL